MNWEYSLNPAFTWDSKKLTQINLGIGLPLDRKCW